MLKIEIIIVKDKMLDTIILHSIFHEIKIQHQKEYLSKLFSKPVVHWTMHFIMK